MSTPITAAELRGTELPVRRFGEGYDVAEVDAFLQRAAGALDGTGPGLTSDDVHAVTFTQVPWRAGYDVGAVDDLLDRLADALRRTPRVGRHAAAPVLTAADLRAVHLPGAALLAPGYVREDVDALLRRAASALAHRGAGGPGLSVDDVRAARFGSTRRGGYDVAAVDELVERVAHALADLGG
ncbi:DivIVA domain-containing protein [uncultured Pseudokineococcus sp.]|uniref:DivIVA domain-containing protein n=1 Tax=uncultured Pseudokineococcus sp. TaxID=1642928 RepID=UPI002623B4C1|nr:DivIVA domain-containing protein [uncultured Pseudokineococcus sp.]